MVDFPTTAASHFAIALYTQLAVVLISAPESGRPAKRGTSQCSYELNLMIGKIQRVPLREIWSHEVST